MTRLVTITLLKFSDIRHRAHSRLMVFTTTTHPLFLSSRSPWKIGSMARDQSDVIHADWAKHKKHSCQWEKKYLLKRIIRISFCSPWLKMRSCGSLCLTSVVESLAGFFSSSNVHFFEQQRKRVGKKSSGVKRNKKVQWISFDYDSDGLSRRGQGKGKGEVGWDEVGGNR